MKKLTLVLLAAGLMSVRLAAAQPVRTANPNANARTKAVLAYLTGLEKRTDRRLLSGQFVNFGNGANLRLMDDPWSVNLEDLQKGLAGSP